MVCEACGSSAVTTGSKSIDANTYFNCGKCGHIWHPGRSRVRDDAGSAAGADRPPSAPARLPSLPPATPGHVHVT